MTPTYDFDRLLESVLESNGPQTLPGTLVATALAEARAVRQRRPIVQSLDRRAWPAARPSVADSTMRRYATVGLLMLLILAAIAAAGLVGSRLLARPVSGPLGAIAYIQGGDAYLADPDGGDSVLLLDDPGVDFSAVTWLADGRSLAVEGGGVMNVVDTQSRAVHRIGRLGDWGAMWSPARDAYAYAAGEPTAITIVDVASGRVRDVHPDDVSADSGYVGTLAWTADERWFAASALTDNALVVVDATSGATTEIQRTGTVDTNLFAYQDLAWSPDGSKLAYDTIFDDGHQTLYVVDRNGRTPVELGSISLALPAANHLGRQLLPAWSPDGAWVAFKTDTGLVVARPDGRDLRELRTGPVGPFSWASDGSGITYVGLAGLDDGTGTLSWISLPDGAIRRLGITTDLAFSVRDLPPPAPVDGVVAPSAPVDAGPSEPAPSPVASGSPDRVITPVVETPPSAPPADATRSLFSALVYSKARLGCRDAYRLDLATGASTEVAGCHDEVSPDGRSVASSDVQGLTVSVPSENTTLRVDGPIDASPLAWSPDGRWLAWTRAEDPATGRPAQAGIVSADGSHQVRLPAPDAAWDGLSWSPDGSHVAIPTLGGLLVGQADGSQLKLIGSYPRPQAWAPDGDRFAYLQGGDLWIVNADGTEPTNLTRFEFGGATAADWSPDGGSIAVIQGRTLWFVSLFGSRHGVDLGMDLASSTAQLSWAPSGGVLAVSMETDLTSATSAIDLVSSDGTRVVRIDDAGSPSWSPNGLFIAFHAWDPRAAGIGVANADGSGRRTWKIDGNFSVSPIRWIRGPLSR